MAEKPENITAYIASSAPDVQTILQNVRRTIHDAVPGAGEKISYEIPAITLDGKVLMYFSGWQKHISVYPIPEGDDAFTREIAPYKAGKGTLRFPLSKPIPYDLIGRVAIRFVELRRAGRAAGHT
jgi:uncharacterized protein YdhG (YjbR/CyaY superfamily)